MKKIFRIEPSNKHQVLIPNDLLNFEWRKNINLEFLSDSWHPPEFRFEKFRKARKIPVITGFSGGFAFRKDLKNALFPMPCEKLEFLPILASGVDWLVVNCLKTTKKYDEKQSLFTRDLSDLFPGEDGQKLLLTILTERMRTGAEDLSFFRQGHGQIGTIEKLTIYDSSLDDCELFTIEDSNRANVFALSSFVERVQRLKLEGLDFKEIGVLWDDVSAKP
jgi:hypothetical protein